MDESQPENKIVKLVIQILFFGLFIFVVGLMLKRWGVW